jgi:hypothetical protein
MSYTLYKTNGTALVTVVDGSLDNSTDLTFVGKNYSGYGAIVNQDLVKLLENFAGKLQPTKSLTGQLWYDSVKGRLKVNVGGYYKPVANIESDTTPPSNSTKTDLWYDESVGKLKYFDGSNYIVIGPQISGATSDNLFEYASVLDDGGNSHNVLQARTTSTTGAGVITAIISPEEFIVNPSSSLKSNFYTIKKGITLSGTDHLSGVGSNFELWGDASNSQKIGGYLPRDIVKEANPVVSGIFTSTNDLGFEINATTRIRNDGQGGTLLANLQTGNRVSVSVNIGGGLVDVVNFWSRDSAGPEILPTQAVNSYPNSTNIGSSVSRFGSIYSKGFTSVSGTVTVDNKVATTTATVMTVMPRYAKNVGRGIDITTPMSIGSADAPFDTIYATNIVADSVSNVSLVAKTFTSTQTRDTYYSLNPGARVQGLIVLTGAIFQGWTGAAWVNLS